jgi:hypothetical protein
MRTYLDALPRGMACAPACSGASGSEKEKRLPESTVLFAVS